MNLCQIYLHTDYKSGYTLCKFIIMLSFWIQFVFFIISMIIYFCFTVVFCFWCVYLIDAIKRKRIFYKMRNLESDTDSHQQLLAYNAKTELVKYWFLFFMNIIEWLGCTFTIISYVLFIVQQYHIETHKNDSLVDFVVYIPKSSEILFHFNLPDFDNVCIVLSFALIGSLCIYLSARYAQKSWITSNTIPYWISFFVISSILSQILIIICYTNIIGLWCDALLISISIVFAFKQYRKLYMVIHWSTVDQQVSGNKRMLAKQIRMERTFNTIFIIVLTGAFLISLSEYFEAILDTIHRFSNKNASVLTSLCGKSYHSNPDISQIYTILLYVEVTVAVIGCFIIFFPYIVSGLATMSLILCRLLRGKTGYRTHFPVQLHYSLIQSRRCRHF